MRVLRLLMAAVCGLVAIFLGFVFLAGGIDHWWPPALFAAAAILLAADNSGGSFRLRR